jgi:hypothetical protein
MQRFTPALARRFIDELALTVKNDIVGVEDSQIEDLKMLDGQKAIFRRIRGDLVNHDQKVERRG